MNSRFKELTLTPLALLFCTASSALQADEVTIAIGGRTPKEWVKALANGEADPNKAADAFKQFKTA